MGHLEGPSSPLHLLVHKAIAMSGSPLSPLQKCALERVEFVFTDGLSYDSAEELGHDHSLSLERVNVATHTADLILIAHDETINKELVSGSPCRTTFI